MLDHYDFSHAIKNPFAEILNRSEDENKDTPESPDTPLDNSPEKCYTKKCRKYFRKLQK